MNTTIIACTAPISIVKKIQLPTAFVFALASTLYSSGGVAQDITCDNLPPGTSPLYNGCETTPVGVCDEEAAASFVTGNGRNRWTVTSSNPEAERCSTVDLADKNNPYVVTAQDDTNTLQCALDFGAAGRVSTGLEATIIVEDGRYCIRKALIAIDFSGVIKGSGMDNAVIDIDAPVFRDTPPDGKDRGIILSGGLSGKEADVSKNGIRSQSLWDAAFSFYDHELDHRHVKFRDLSFNIAEGTMAVASTVHGLLSTASGFYESTQAVILDGDRFDGVGTDRSAFILGNCALVPALWPWPEEYEEDTGVDILALDPLECLVPFQADIPSDSTKVDEDGNYLGDDLDNLPSHSVSLRRIKSDMHGRAHNGVLIALGQRTIATPNQTVFLSPYTGRYLIADSVLLGGNNDAIASDGVGNNGSPYDFGGNLWDGSIKVVRNYIGRSPNGIGLCGRWIENVGNKSGTTIRFSHNVIDQCRGAVVFNGLYASQRGIGVDQLPVANSSKPLPDLAVLTVSYNEYTQDPDDPGLPRSRFVFIRDLANSELMRDLGLEPRPTIEARIRNNRISVNSPTTGHSFGAPIFLQGVANSQIVGNVIAGANGAGISIGGTLSGIQYGDSGNQVKRNDLTEFDVVPCEFPEESYCNTATDAKIWLGSATHDNLVISTKPDGGTSIVGDLGTDNKVLGGK